MSHKYSNKKSLGLFIIGGLLILVALALALKPKVEIGTSQADLTLEAQLDDALKEKQPTFVFLHSLDCIPCQEMMEIVSQVYPEFEGQVVLIDVNVDDQRNTNILIRERLQIIPTLVFYDRSGERYVHIGVLPKDQLHDVFQTLSGE